MRNYEFSSVFREELRNYVKMRENQGFRDGNLYILQKLDKYLVEQGVRDKMFTSDITDGFIAAHRNGRSSSTMSHYSSMCAVFARHLITLGFPAFVPEYIKPSYDYVPYVFTEKEMTDIITAADNMLLFGNTEWSNKSKFQFPMLLRLLYGCGLRLGEALKLRLSDVDFNVGVLRVLNAKGNKDRLVPMDESLTAILEKYCGVILSGKGNDCFLFAGEYETKPRHKTWVQQRFKAVLQASGIDVSVKSMTNRVICVHCLRHTFAVHSFRKQDLAGIDNYRETPSLSVYLGHLSLTGTEKYLHMTAENSEDIIAATSSYSKGLFPEVPQ